MENERKEKFNQRFYSLVKKAHQLGEGVHNIRVKKVLAVGVYTFLMPPIAIVEDINGRILIIPEDKNGHSKLSPLVSRWDVRRNMKLRLVVDKKNNTRVFKT